MPWGTLGGASHTFCLVEAEKRCLDFGALELVVVDIETRLEIYGSTIHVTPPWTEQEMSQGASVIRRPKNETTAVVAPNRSRVVGTVAEIAAQESIIQQSEARGRAMAASRCHSLALQGPSAVLLPEEVPNVSG